MHPADLSQFHRQFQQALLALLRDEGAEERLRELRRLSLRFEELVHTLPAKSFWSSVVGVFDGVETVGERPRAETLRLLGGVERSVSTWMAVGESCFASKDFETLASELRQLQPSSGRREDEIPAEQAFRPTTDAQDSDLVPNAAALKATLKNLAEHPAWLADDSEDTSDRDVESNTEKPAIEEPPRAELAEEVSAAPLSGESELRVATSKVSPQPTGLAPLVSTRLSPDTADSGLTRPTAVVAAPDQAPISNTYSRLKWVGRESCQALGRHAEIRSAGDGLIDRRLLKSMLEPLDCLIRNAVYYGIESGDDRLEAGKSPVGNIGLTFHHGTDSRYLNIETDGLAVDPERLHRKAESLGLVKASDQLSRGQLLELLLAKDFTTAHVATQTAGFGIGLHEAARQLAASGCTLSLSPGRRSGLCFTIHLPD